MRFIKKLPQVMANFQGQIILMVVYLTLVPIFAIVIKILKYQQKRGWSKWQFESNTIEDLKKQY